MQFVTIHNNDVFADVFQKAHALHQTTTVYNSVRPNTPRVLIKIYEFLAHYHHTTKDSATTLTRLGIQT